MAEFDGRITIGTKIDTSGFKAGSDELLSAIRSLTDKIDALGKTVEAAFAKMSSPDAARGMSSTAAAAGKAERSMRSMSKSTSSLGKDILAAGRKIESLGPLAERAAEGGEAAFRRFGDRASNMDAVIRSLRSRLEEFGATRTPTKEYAELEERLKGLRAQLEGFRAAGLREDAMAGVKRSIAETEAEMQRLRDTGADAVLGSSTDEYREYEAEIEGLEERMIEFRNVATPPTAAEAAWARLMGTLAQVRAKVTDFAAGMREAVSGAAPLTEQIGGFFDSVLEKIDGAVDKVRQFGSSISSAIGSGLSSAGSAIMRIPEAVDGIVSGGLPGVLSGLNTMLGKIAGAATYAAGSLLRIAGGAVITGIKGIASAALNAAAGFARMVGSGIVGFLKNVATHAGQAAMNLVKMAGSRITSPIANLARSVLGLGRSTQSASGQMKHSFLTILKYGFGIRSLFFLFRRLRNALTEGLKSLAAVNPELNSSISGMMGALTNLRNAFASAFSPIIQVVAPIITYFINMLTAAVNHIGMLIAALTGKPFYKASGATAKFAGTTEKAGKAAGKTAKAVKEEKRQLASFDKLDILSGSNSGGGGGGAGGGGGSGGGGGLGGGFTRTAIEPAVFEWIERLKAAFRKGDYEAVGAILAQKINEQLQRVKDLISWNNVGPTIQKYVDMIARIFNSLVDNIDWGLIGRTFSEGANTIMRSLDLILTSIDFTNLGSKIAQGLNGAVGTLNWTLLGKTLADRFNAVLDTLYGAVTGFNWTSLGRSLGNAVNGFIRNVKWSEIGQTVTNAFKGAFDSVAEFMKTVDWSSMAHDVEEAFGSVDWSAIAKSAFNALGAAFGGLASFLGTLLNDAFKNISDYFDNSIDEAGGDVIQGIFNGILNAVKGIGKWIYDNIFSPFIDGFKGAFGIHSPSKEMEPLGGNIIEGMLNGITSFMSGIGTWLGDHVLGPIKDALQGAWNTAGMVVDVGVNLVKDGWSNFTDWIGEKKEAAIDVLVGLKEKAGAWSKDAWDALKSGGGTVVGTVQTALTKASTWAGDAWTAVQSGGKTAVHTLSSAVQKAGNWVGDAWSAVKEAGKSGVHTLNSAVQKAQAWGAEAWSAVNKDGDSGTHTLRSAVSKGSWVTDAWNAATTKLGTFTRTLSQRLTKGSWNSDASTALKAKLGTFKRTLEVGVKAAAGTTMSFIKKILGRASGGIYSGGGWTKLPQFASGGVINGATRAIRHFTTAASGYSGHGSLVLAGERGPEIVGHVGGKTEILNKSQMASALYSAVVAGMTNVSNRLAMALANIVAQGAGAIRDAVAYTATAPVVLPPAFDNFPADVITGLEAVRSVVFSMPAMATGTVMPYSTTAQAASADDIQQALNLSNDMLANRLTAQINAAAVAIVQAVREAGASSRPISTAALTQAAIDEINRRTVAFGGSPLTGV